MEINKKSLSFLLEKLYYFHDSNIEKIVISYEPYEKTAKNDYPKENACIQIVVQLPKSADISFSEKIIRLNFIDVEEFKIRKCTDWQWLISSASVKNIDNTFNIFFIDNYLSIIFKCFNWDFVI